MLLAQVFPVTQFVRVVAKYSIWKIKARGSRSWVSLVWQLVWISFRDRMLLWLKLRKSNGDFMSVVLILQEATESHFRQKRFYSTLICETSLHLVYLIAYSLFDCISSDLIYSILNSTKVCLVYYLLSCCLAIFISRAIWAKSSHIFSKVKVVCSNINIFILESLFYAYNSESIRVCRRKR